MAVISYYVGPWHGTVPLTTGGTAYNLQTLLLAHAEPPFDTSLTGSRQVSILTIQFPFTGAGYLYIGNRWLSLTDRGIELVPSQTYPYPILPSNVLNLDHVWLMSDTSTQEANITICRSK